MLYANVVNMLIGGESTVSREGDYVSLLLLFHYPVRSLEVDIEQGYAFSGP